MADFSRADNAQFVTVAAQTATNSYFQLFAFAGTLHFVSAALLFAFLAYYSFRVFTRVILDEHCLEGAKLKPVKRTRNWIYYASVTVIVAAVAIIFANFLFERFSERELAWWYRHNVALWAFGVSWIVKGRFFDNAWLDDRDRRRTA